MRIFKVLQFLLTTLLLVLLLIVSVYAVNPMTVKNMVILSKLGFDDNKYFIQELNLDTGFITKNFIRAKGIVGDEIERVIDIGNRNVLLIGMQNYGTHNGYGLIYNLDSHSMTRLDFIATSPEDIEIQKNNSIFIINYKLSNQRENSGKANTLVYRNNTLKLIANWKNSYQNLVSLDKNYVYYTDDKNVVICSNVNGKEIKRIPLDISYDIFNNGQAIGYDSNGVYKLTDLFTQKSKFFELPDDKTGYGYPSEDNKWLVVLFGKSTKSTKTKYNGEIVVINTDNGEKRSIVVNAENLNTDSIRSGEAIFFRNNEVYLCGKTTLVSINLHNGNTSSKPIVYVTDTATQRISRVDTLKIKELIANYEKSLVEAINTGDFSIVERYLAQGSNLYKSQQKLVSNLYSKQTKEKLVTFSIQAITSMGENTYKVSVVEKIGIKTAKQNVYTNKEFRWTYTVIVRNGHYFLSDIEK